MKSKIVEETKKVLAELKTAKAENKSVAQVAQEMRTENKSEVETKAVKVRDVKDFIVKNVSDDDVVHSALKTVQERRAYRVSSEAENDNTLYNATMYRNAETQQLELLTQSIANKLVDDFIAKQEKLQAFSAHAIRELHKTCGGAFGDKIRKRLFARSVFFTHATLKSLTNEQIATILQEKHKDCYYFDIYNDEARRQTYNFVRVF